MSTAQQIRFHGGPLHSETLPKSPMGRTATAYGPNRVVVRNDKADQALGRSVRLGTPVDLYFLTHIERGDEIDTFNYTWVQRALPRMVSYWAKEN